MNKITYCTANTHLAPEIYFEITEKLQHKLCIHLKIGKFHLRLHQYMCICLNVDEKEEEKHAREKSVY